MAELHSISTHSVPQYRPGKRGPIPRSLEDRLRDKVRIGSESECWEWTGQQNASGYGRIRRGTSVDGTRRMDGVHRVAYELAVGPIPEGHGVLHHCDNRLCCNPAHLFTGTNTDNNRDRDEKGRCKNPPRYAGESHPTAKLTAKDVVEIRRLLEVGLSQSIIGGMFGVCHSTIGRIFSGKRWRD